MSDLGERLRRERTRRGERQADAAKRFDVSQPSYHRWERGENNPDLVHFPALAQYLGLTIEEVHRLVTVGEMPTSLDVLRSEVSELRRDVTDLRDLIRQMADAAKVARSEADLRRDAHAEALIEATKDLGRARRAKPKAPSTRRSKAG